MALKTIILGRYSPIGHLFLFLLPLAYFPFFFGGTINTNSTLHALLGPLNILYKSLQSIEIHEGYIVKSITYSSSIRRHNTNVYEMVDDGRKGTLE